jgi:hypothetical protein
MKTIGYSLGQCYLGNRPTSKSSSIDEMHLQHEKMNLVNVYYDDTEGIKLTPSIFHSFDFFINMLPSVSEKSWALGDNVYSLFPKT